MKKLLALFKKEIMLSVSLVAAIISLFISPPDAQLLKTIDWKTLATLFMLLSVLEGFKKENIFSPLLKKTSCLSSMRGLTTFFVFSVFLTSMFVMCTKVPLQACTGNSGAQADSHTYL